MQSPIICYDPFRLVQLGTKALEKVRRSVWQGMRTLEDQSLAKRFKGGTLGSTQEPP